MSSFKMRIYFVLLCCVLIATGSTAQPKPSISKMKWLIGSWRGMASNKPFYEAWRQNASGGLTQYGIQISGTDTLISEIGKITVSDSKASYGDNRNTWTLSELTADKMIFTNDQLRFPKAITWQKMPNGHWYCLLKANEQKIEYDIERLPALDAAVDKWVKANKKS